MISKLLYGYIITQCLYVAAKLNIADHLENGSKSIEELATLTDTHYDSLNRVLRCLVTHGIFQIDENDRYALNDDALELLSDNENTLKDYVILCGEELYQSAGELLFTVKTGKSSFEKIYKQSHWQYLECHSDKAQIFHNAMEKGSQKLHDEILKHYDFSSYKQIVDVGGGKGHLLCDILAKYPATDGIVFDLKHAEQLSNEYVNSRNLEKRCQFISGNFFESIPENADLYLLKTILHDWSDEHALNILRNCKRAMKENSKLLIIEKVVNITPNDTALLGDINMLAMYSGKERTLTEFQSLLNQAGLQLNCKINTDTAFSIVEAVLKLSFITSAN